MKIICTKCGKTVYQENTVYHLNSTASYTWTCTKCGEIDEVTVVQEVQTKLKGGR